MNRKQRRLAERTGHGPAQIAALNAAAVAEHRAGRIAEADALCRRSLAADPLQPDALHLRGLIAQQQGRLADAHHHIAAALAIAPDAAPMHHNAAVVLRALGRDAEAIAHYRQAASLQPSAGSLCNLGNVLLAQGRIDEAGSAYARALRLDGNLPEAHNGVGCVLQAKGAPEAGAAFARAIACRPGFAPAHENLVQARLTEGAFTAALEAAVHAVRRADTPRLRGQFVTSLLAVPPACLPATPELRAVLLRALVERWTRPVELARAAGALVDPARLEGDPLLAALLESAPVCDITLEAALVACRAVLLDRAGRPGADGVGLGFAVALARQCFINEYVWACDDAERHEAAALRDAIAASLASGAPIAPLDLAVAAAYAPLGALSGVDTLVTRPWPAEFAALVAQQVTEPARERALRATIPRLTPIADDVSVAVRAQYEEHPYPRWVAAPAPRVPLSLEAWLRQRFPHAPLRRLPGVDGIDILVAGCGTGQQPVATARNFSSARVLAIDLSLASLTYARRMTEALGIGTIEYAQADLLQVGALGRTFDAIECAGVLHHLGDPWEGWRRLLGVLRPDGAMYVALYSRRARIGIGLARDWIAASGYDGTAAGIRACRQALVAEAAPWVAPIVASPEFFATSTCRDLLFHVQEQAVGFADIAAFVAADGLSLIGVDATAEAEGAYRARFPDDPAMADLARWDAVEAEHPDIFAGMIGVWVQRGA